MRISLFSSEKTLSDDYNRATDEQRYLLGTSPPSQPRICSPGNTAFRSCDCCHSNCRSALNFLLFASSSTSQSNGATAVTPISTTSSAVEIPFDRLEPLSRTTTCSHDRSLVTGCSGRDHSHTSFSPVSPSDSDVRRRPMPVALTSSTVAAAIVGDPDSTHGRSASSMPASPSSSTSLRLQFGASLNEVIGQRRRDLSRSASLDDEPSRLPFVPDCVDDAIQGDSGRVQSRFRSIGDVSRKRRTVDGATHSTSSHGFEQPRRNSSSDNMNESSDGSNEDVCDEEVSDLLGTNDAFPPLVSHASGTRYGRLPIDIRESSSSSFGTTSATLNDSVNVGSELWLQRQQRQSPSKRRRSSDECNGPPTLTSSSTHRPSLDLYKMQVWVYMFVYFSTTHQHENSAKAQLTSEKLSGSLFSKNFINLSASKIADCGMLIHIKKAL